MRIGFVGLGLMGRPIARRLIAGGHELVFCTANRQAADEFRALGATRRDTPAEVAADVEAFFACRVTPEHSLATFLGPDGVRAAGRKGLLCVDLATITPEVSRRIAGELAASGLRFIDAPVSGGPDGATAGTLSVIAGGTAEDVAAAEQLLLLFGKTVFHMGAVGAGGTAKLCNNMITITTHALVAEAMVLGVKAGLDARALYDMLRASTAFSRTLERVVPGHFLPRDFTAASSITTVMKDLGCALAEGERLGVALSLPQTAMRRLEAAAAEGFSELDIAAVIRPIEAEAGVTVGTACRGASG